MITIYTLYGGEIFTTTLNAISAMFGSSSWSTVARMALTTSVVVYAARFLINKDPMKFLKWVFVYLFVIGVLIVPKKSVQIIDLSDPTQTYKVDNVPVGVAGVFSLFTSIGYGLSEKYDTFFNLPDSQSYSKTGFLFGANLARTSLFDLSNNPRIAGNLSQYVKQCVVGDIMINQKYSLDDLLNSSDIMTLITSNPSPIRRLIYKNSAQEESNITCQEAAKEILSEVSSDTQGKKESLITMLQRNFYGLTNSTLNNQILLNLFEDSYSLYFKSSKDSISILKQNVAISAIKSGMRNFASSNDDMGSLVSMTTQDTEIKNRLNWSVSAKIATTYLPLLHTIAMILLIALFPIIVLLTLTDLVGLNPLKNWVFSLIYLISWCPLFSILNYAANFYLLKKLEGDITLSNIDSMKLQFSDFSMIAGYLTLSIPFLAGILTKGLTSVATHMAGSINGALGAASTHVSAQAADGNWNMGQINMENVQGFKWDTNQTQNTGSMTRNDQYGNTITTAPSGHQIMSVNQGNLATDINFTSSVNAGLARAQSSIQAENASLSNEISGLNSVATQDIDSANTRNSHLVSSGKNFSSSSDVAITKAIDNLSQLARSWSETHSDGSTIFSSASAKAEVGFKMFGSGASAEVSGGKSTADTDTTARARDQKMIDDYRENMNILTKASQGKLGAINDSYNAEKAKSISSSFNASKSISSRIAQNESVSSNINDEIRRNESNSVSVNNKLSNEYADFVHKVNPVYANEILGNTHDSKAREQRGQLADSFTASIVDEKINSMYEAGVIQMEGAYQQKNRNILSKASDAGLDNKLEKPKITPPSNIKSEKEILEDQQELIENFNAQQEEIKNRQEEVKSEVQKDVVGDNQNEPLPELSNGEKFYYYKGKDEGVSGFAKTDDFVVWDGQGERPKNLYRGNEYGMVEVSNRKMINVYNYAGYDKNGNQVFKLYTNKVKD